MLHNNQLNVPDSYSDFLMSAGAILENAPQAVVITNAENRIVYVNHKTIEITGYEKEEFFHMPIKRFFFTSPESHFNYDDHIRPIRQANDFEQYQVKEDGSGWWSRVKISPISGADGRQIGTTFQFEDVSEEHHLRQESQFTLEQQRMLFENNPVPMLIYDLESTLVQDVNNLAVERYGYSQEEFIGMPISNLHHVEDLDSVVENVRNIKEESNNSDEWVHVLKDESTIHVEIFAKSIMYHGRKSRLVIMKDISDRKDAELASKYNEEKFVSIVDNMDLAVVEVDLRDRITFVNPRFETMSGYKLDEIRGEKYRDIFLDDDAREVMKQEYIKRKHGEASEYDKYKMSIHKKDGTTMEMAISAAPLFDVHGEKIGSIGIHLDLDQDHLRTAV